MFTVAMKNNILIFLPFKWAYYSISLHEAVPRTINV